MFSILVRQVTKIMKSQICWRVRSRPNASSDVVLQDRPENPMQLLHSLPLEATRPKDSLELRSRGAKHIYPPWIPGTELAEELLVAALTSLLAEQDVHRLGQRVVQ